jgi:hypothetical protein
VSPFEILIKELGNKLGTSLSPDQRQSCLLNFSELELAVQIDLDTNADQILLGCELGILPPGSYREQMFRKALRTNAFTEIRLGILAYSEKKNALVLFKFLPLESINADQLFQKLQDFIEHVLVWRDSLKQGTLPTIEEEQPPSKSGMYGLTR